MTTRINGSITKASAFEVHKSQDSFVKKKQSNKDNCVVTKYKKKGD